MKKIHKEIAEIMKGDYFNHLNAIDEFSDSNKRISRSDAKIIIEKALYLRKIRLAELFEKQRFFGYGETARQEKKQFLKDCGVKG